LRDSPNRSRASRRLLIATRGNVPAPAPGTQALCLIEAPTGQHSEKPQVFAEMIERQWPNTPKLEMFARQPRPGWDVWGNEVCPELAGDDDDAIHQNVAHQAGSAGT